MIMKAIKDFIEKNCPCLSDYYEGIGVDYLSEDVTSYSVEAIPTEPIVKTYLDGSTVRKQDFLFSSRETYGDDVRQNLENLGFYEKFAAWLEECNEKEIFPDLGEGKEVRKIEALTTGYPYIVDVHEAKYQIQCSIKYFQEV